MKCLTINEIFELSHTLCSNAIYHATHEHLVYQFLLKIQMKGKPHFPFFSSCESTSTFHQHFVRALRVTRNIVNRKYKKLNQFEVESLTYTQRHNDHFTYMKLWRYLFLINKFNLYDWRPYYTIKTSD